METRNKAIARAIENIYCPKLPDISHGDTVTIEAVSNPDAHILLLDILRMPTGVYKLSILDDRTVMIASKGVKWKQRKYSSLFDEEP